MAGGLRATFPDAPHRQVAHEAIYRSLFVQVRGVLKQELLAHLRPRRVMRRYRPASITGQHRGQIADTVTTSERQRSRKTLGFRTPADSLAAVLR